uniref:Uncharacterized protein n=1 Tax=Rhizobium rhizogenes TaxID=359 RepID=A0A7S4ZUD6_RHIRH|nr:hypothetical protein pC6.5c_639 [Rhizobium rhizogenes]
MPTFGAFPPKKADEAPEVYPTIPVNQEYSGDPRNLKAQSLQ